MNKTNKELYQEIENLNIRVQALEKPWTEMAAMYDFNAKSKYISISKEIAEEWRAFVSPFKGTDYDIRLATEIDRAIEIWKQRNG